MIPAISQVCSLPSPFEGDVADYAAGKCPAIEVWLTKLEQYLKQHSLDEARRLFAEHEILPAVASFQGGILASQGEARRESWQLFERRLRLCHDLAIETMVIAADVPAPLTQEMLDRVAVSLQEAAVAAGRAGRRIALEFQHKSAFVSNLQTAVAVIEDVGSPHLGFCLDAFHFHVGPSKTQDLAYLSADNLFHVQFCDLVDTARELASDADRILPGDGEIPLQPIVARLREIGYDRYVSVEVMNPQLWQVPPRQFGEISLTALRRVLGLADHPG